MAIKLNSDVVEHWIEYFAKSKYINLPEEEIDKIRFCVDRYTPKKGTWNYLCYIAGLVYDAFLTMFGKNARQVAKAVIKKAVRLKLNANFLRERYEEASSILLAALSPHIKLWIKLNEHGIAAKEADFSGTTFSPDNFMERYNKEISP